MDDYQEFSQLHLPHLFSYVTPVLRQWESGRIDLGSGVLVRAGERHFIATAKHCIDKHRVRAARPIDPSRHRQSRESNLRDLKILSRGWHASEDLDIGYLEIADPECPELRWDQLCDSRIDGGRVHFVGYPKALVEKIERIPGKLTDVSICEATFGTTLTEQTEDEMTFDYPVVGSKYDDSTGTWFDSPFPETPEGFSGGACFGVVRSTGTIAEVGFKLLAIQHSWREGRREVYATPIKRWRELLEARGLVEPQA